MEKNLFSQCVLDLQMKVSTDLPTYYASGHIAGVSGRVRGRLLLIACIVQGVGLDEESFQLYVSVSTGSIIEPKCLRGCM